MEFKKAAQGNEKWLLLLAIPLFGMGVHFFNTINVNTLTYVNNSDHSASTSDKDSQIKLPPVWPATLDKKEYDARLLAMVHYTPPAPIVATTTNPDGSIGTTTKQVSDLTYATSSNVVIDGKNWPRKAVYPHGDAILPFYRILAYYGNFYSTRMGILGELPEDEVIQKLMETKDMWEAADKTTPVLPAIEYIAMVAQADAGSDGMYRAMMPDTEIEKAYEMAKKINGILILDLQIGKSTIYEELPKFKKYIERPEVHIALDPEFAMKYGEAPGTVIGTFDAQEINYTIDYISDIVKEKQLPPKILLVHRFTEDMVTNATKIKPTSEVQVVMVMDGWGPKELKYGTYSHTIIPEPVQFTGVKIFYKNDLKPPSTGIWTPQEVLDLNPIPLYIQYQ